MSTCPTCRASFDQGTFCPRDGARLVEDKPAERVLGQRYRLIRKVGEGAMGEVYEAEHLFLHRRVAVKILRPTIAALPEALARLQREAESMSGLGHLNIVDALDFGRGDDGLAYLVMEWLDGQNLDDFLASAQPEVATALEIAAQAAAGLAEAHERGVIHRDLKPANLFVTHNRKGELVIKVLDFGIAKLAESNTKLTATGVLVGTPNYMAPEQATGDAVDGRADVYALGVILYEMLTGRVPFQGDSALAVLHQHTSKIPAPPSVTAPGRGISAELDGLVMRCLAKRPADRYESMHELGAALGAIQRPAIALPPGPRVEELAADTASELRPAGTSRIRLVIAGVLAVGVIAAVVMVIASRGGAATTHASARLDAAVVVATVDAARVDAGARLDAAGPQSEPRLMMRAQTPHFSYVAEMPRRTSPAVPFELTISISDLDPAIQAAGQGTPLLARILVRYYIDHSVIFEASQPVGQDGVVTARVTAFKPGKHHVHVELLSGLRELEHATFDIFVGGDRAPEATVDHEHGHDHDAHQ